MSDDFYNGGRLRLYKRGAVYHIRGTYNGKLVRRTTGRGDIRMATVALNDLYTELQTEWRVDKNSEDASWHRVARWMCARQKTQAKWRGIPFELTPGDVYEMMRLAEFRCSLSGIALTKRTKPDDQPDPWSASIDRIEPRHGYVRGNVRVVCLAANLAMNRWGFDTLLRLANAVVRNSGAAAQPENLTICASENGHYSNDIN